MKNYSLILLSLGLGSCAFTCDDSSVTVTTSVRTVFGVRVSNIITGFFPTAGSLYRVGDQISFELNSRRNGYVTLVIYNPDGQINDPNLRNIPVYTGRNIIPQNVSLRAAPPTGDSCVVAIFTPAARVGFTFSGSFSNDFFNSSLNFYLNPFAESERDIAQSCIRVTF